MLQPSSAAWHAIVSVPRATTRLVARKGNIVTHHFAHHKSSDCANALETALHLAAKQIFERHKKIRLPAVHSYVGSGRVELHPEQMVEVDHVHLEKRQDDVVPDVILDLRGRYLFVEIAVTHFVEAEKEKKLKNMGISTIEIDLSSLDRQITLDVLESILVEQIGRKTWIHNAKEVDFRNGFQKRYGKELPVISRGSTSQVNNCPLGKRTSTSGRIYADIDEDCSPCDHADDVRRDDEGLPTHITCLGHSRFEIDEFIKSYEKGGTLRFMYEPENT
jgi:hypothetical protein